MWVHIMQFILGLNITKGWGREEFAPTFRASLISSVGKESSFNVGDRIQSLGWQDPLEEERLPTPVFWPGEFHGLYSPWGHKESDNTETFLLFFLVIAWAETCLLLPSEWDLHHHLRWFSDTGPEILYFEFKLHHWLSSIWSEESINWKRLVLGKIESERRGQQMMRWLESITDSMYMNLSKLWEIVEDRRALHAAALGITKSQTWLSDWTTTATGFLGSPVCRWQSIELISLRNCESQFLIISRLTLLF